MRKKLSKVLYHKKKNFHFFTEVRGNFAEDSEPDERIRQKCQQSQLKIETSDISDIYSIKFLSLEIFEFFFPAYESLLRLLQRDLKVAFFGKTAFETQSTSK